MILTIDGLNGVGKTTQAQLLTTKLDKMGYNVEYLHFPRYDTEWGAIIKRYLSGDLQVSNVRQAALLFTMDRMLISDTITRDDKIFIVDRYTPSALIHQMSCLLPEQQEVFRDWLIDLEYNKLRIPEPATVVILTASDEVRHKVFEDRLDADADAALDIHEATPQRDAERQETIDRLVEFFDNWTEINCCNSETGEFEDAKEINKKVYKAISGSLDPKFKKPSLKKQAE